MNEDLHESTLRNRRRAVTLFEDFIRMCLNDIEHPEVNTTCRNLIKRLINYCDKENSMTCLVDRVFESYCCMEESTCKISNENDLVIVIDGWTKCLFSNTGFDGLSRDHFMSSTIQTFRQNLQAYAKQHVGRQYESVVGAVFKGSKFNLLKKKRQNDEKYTETSGKNDKRAFFDEEIDGLLCALFSSNRFDMMFVINMFRHLCCRKSSLFSISMKHCGLFDFSHEKCCMNIRTEYTKGEGRMLSDSISVFADRTDLRKCAIFSLALCLSQIDPHMELTKDKNLMSTVFNSKKLSENDVFGKFKECFIELYGIEVADQIGFHSFRKYSATILKSALMGDKDAEKILNFRGGWAQEHSKEKGVKSIVSNSDVKSHYISYNEMLDSRAGKILANGYSTMPHLNPLYMFTWMNLGNKLKHEMICSFFPKNLIDIMGSKRDDLVYFGIFLVIGYAKLGDQHEMKIFRNSFFKNQKIVKIVNVLKSIPLDQPADFTQYSYESALRYGLVHEYRISNGKLHKHIFDPVMESFENCDSDSERDIDSDSDSDDDVVVVQDSQYDWNLFLNSLKISKPSKHDIDMSKDDDNVIEQKLQFTYNQVLDLWENGTEKVPPLKNWEIEGILSKIKTENTLLFQKYGNMKRQVQNYHKLGGVHMIRIVLQNKGRKPTIDNAKIKL